MDTDTIRIITIEYRYSKKHITINVYEYIRIRLISAGYGYGYYFQYPSVNRYGYLSDTNMETVYPIRLISVYTPNCGLRIYLYLHK